MPWSIVRRGAEFCVVKDADSSTVACHDSKKKALAQLRALYASEPSLANADHAEQRIIACAALRYARFAPPIAVAHAHRLVNPYPLTDLELAFFDSCARNARDNITRDLAGRRWDPHVAAAVTKTRTRDVSRQLARLEQRLGDQLYSAAVTTMREALKRAGVKAIVRARSKTMRAAVDREGLTDAILAAIHVNADELLDRAFEAYGFDAAQWIEMAAVKRTELIAKMYGLSAAELQDPAIARRAKEAGVLLVSILLDLARGALPTTTPAEEPHVVLPFGAIRLAMRVEQGWIAQPSASPLGVEVLRPAYTVTEELLSRAIDLSRPLPDLDALARGDAVNVPVELGGEPPTLVARYQWRHAFWGEPVTHEFPPHADLDGVEYTDETRGFLLAADPAEWPYVPTYEPGDHDGCTCYEDVLWEPQAEGTREPVGNQVLIEKRGGPF